MTEILADEITPARLSIRRNSLLRVAWRFRARRWYRRFPFLPLPDRAYLRWRMHTAYGDHEAVPPARDVERYALWSVSDS